MQYPPLTLEDVFREREDVLERITSKKYKDEKKWLRVDGVYTDRGHYGVLVNFAEAEKVLKDERWVVPLTKEEQKDGGIAKHLNDVAAEYEEAYVEAWFAFLKDLYIAPPANLKEATELFKLLLDPERPYIRLIRTVSDHTQWTRDLEKVANKRLELIVSQKFNTEAERRARGVRLKIDPFKIVKRPSRVPGTFKPLVRFGIAERGKPLSETPLAQWAEEVDKLRAEILDLLDQRPSAPAQSMEKEINRSVTLTRGLLSSLDARSKDALEPLLLTPLNVGGIFVK